MWVVALLVVTFYGSVGLHVYLMFFRKGGPPDWW